MNLPIVSTSRRRAPAVAFGLVLAAGWAQADPAAEAAVAAAGDGAVAGAAEIVLAQADAPRAQVFETATWTMRSGDAGSERIVKGAPYCAEAVHETVQWLPDGQGGAPNRIVRQQVSRLCRDGEGRTRQEVERDGVRRIYLRDPLAGEAWVLDPERKTARRMAWRQSGPRAEGPGGAGAEERIELHLGAGPDRVLDAVAWRDYAERLRDWARFVADRDRARAAGAPAHPPAPPAPPAAPVAPPAPAAQPAMPAPAPMASPVVIAREAGAPEVRVLRIETRGDGPGFDMPPPPAAWRVPLGAPLAAPRGPGVVTPLGQHDVEGVRANGERTTWTIESGKVGNEKPIVIVREVWTSPELMLTVMSRDFDPRSGETSYRLRQLRRGEPDAALLRVPPDFRRPGPAGGASAPRG